MKLIFFAEVLRYLAEHPIRKVLWKLVYKKKELEKIPSLRIDVSHLSKEQIEKFKVDLIHLNKNDPIDAVTACFIKGGFNERALQEGKNDPDEIKQSIGQKLYRLGDKIVLKDQALLPDIWVVTKIHNDGRIGYKSALQGYPPPESFWELYATHDQIRHATAYEINQKKRALQEDIEQNIKSKDAFLVLYRESIHYQSLKEQHPDHSDDFICQFCAASDDFIDPYISDAYRIFKACSYECVEDDKAYEVAIAQLNQHNIEMAQRRIQFENGEFVPETIANVRTLTHDSEGNCLHFHHEFGHKKCMDCGECLKEWQPDWSVAPDEANWWAMDSFCASWFFDAPVLKQGLWSADSLGQAPSFNYQGDWRNSLRKRPEMEVERHG